LPSNISYDFIKKLERALLSVPINKVDCDKVSARFFLTPQDFGFAADAEIGNDLNSLAKVDPILISKIWAHQLSHQINDYQERDQFVRADCGCSGLQTILP
jgi:hypothetical protein